MKYQSIYDKMVDTGINAIVGGGDPVVIGQQNIDVIEKMFTIEPGMNVLDFGCGCGRVALPLLDKVGEHGKIVGVDIIPAMIEFCRNEISSVQSNAHFYQLGAQNSHYTEWTDSQAADESKISDLSELEQHSFDLIVAFSVFTHLDMADTKKYLKQLYSLLRPGGTLVISVMFINESSRRGLRDQVSNVPYPKRMYSKRRDIYFGNPQDKLAAVGFREASLIELAVNAGLELSQIYYGAWPGRKDRACGQDVVSFLSIPTLPEGFDAKRYLSLHTDIPWDPDTNEGQQRAIRHYLDYGFYEERQWQ